MNAVTMIRQGDICMVKVDIPPANLVRKPAKHKQCTVGYGEVSGHNHVVLDAEWLVAPETTDDDLRQFALGNRLNMPIFVVVDADTILSHQLDNGVPTTDHAPLALAAGTWQVIRQEEYVPGELRRAVID